MWALNGIQSSLITQPHSVLASHADVSCLPTLYERDRADELALSAALGVPFLIGGVIALAAGAGPTLIALGFALVTWQAEEFLTPGPLLRGRLAAVVALDVISYGGQLVALVALAVAGSFTVASGLAVAGLTAAGAAVLGLILLRKTLFHSPLPGAVGRTSPMDDGCWAPNWASSSAPARIRSCSRPRRAQKLSPCSLRRTSSSIRSMSSGSRSERLCPSG